MSGPLDEDAATEATGARRLRPRLIAIATVTVIVVFSGIVVAGALQAETRTVEGTFMLWESGGGQANQFLSRDNGDPCRGQGGYSDIGPSTSVTLSDLAGVPIARTTLGTGEIVNGRCLFTYQFEVTEGEDAYVLEIGRRGESTYTFDEITTPGEVSLVLGG